MSIEVAIFPALFDLAVLMHILMEDCRRATVVTRMEKGLLTQEEAADMKLEVEALRRAGCEIRSASAPDTEGSAAVIHTDQGYDLGLRRNEQGAYQVLAHWSKQPGKAQIQQVSADVEARIKQKYAYEKVKRELAKKGFVVASEEVQPDNTIRLVARKW